MIDLRFLVFADRGCKRLVAAFESEGDARSFLQRRFPCTGTVAEIADGPPETPSEANEKGFDTPWDRRLTRNALQAILERLNRGFVNDCQ